MREIVATFKNTWYFARLPRIANAAVISTVSECWTARRTVIGIEMTTCFSRSWCNGRKDHEERLLTFISEEDRDAYTKECSDIGRLFEHIDERERRRLLSRRNVQSTVAIVLRNQFSGLFQELE
jgi:hypothetical protein